MKIKQLAWTTIGSKLFPNDIFSEPVLGSRYQIGPRYTAIRGQDSIYLFGHGVCELVSSIDEGKAIVQKEFESRVIEEYFE